MKLDLNAVLAEIGKTPADIKKIYHGLDHCCRCGCGGKYFYRDKPEDKHGFTRAMNKLLSGKFEVREKGEEHFVKLHGCNEVCEGIDVGPSKIYVNIPEANTDDKCYCLYFDND